MQRRRRNVREAAKFLDDLAQHAEQDLSFQKALEENRVRRAVVLNAAKARSKAVDSASAKSPARAPQAKIGLGPREAKANE